MQRRAAAAPDRGGDEVGAGDQHHRVGLGQCCSYVKAGLVFNV